MIPILLYLMLELSLDISAQTLRSAHALNISLPQRMNLYQVNQSTPQSGNKQA